MKVVGEMDHCRGQSHFNVFLLYDRITVLIISKIKILNIY